MCFEELVKARDAVRKDMEIRLQNVTEAGVWIFCYSLYAHKLVILLYVYPVLQSKMGAWSL